ncbi:MAG TPA: DUF72 domain-containing protein [Polyangia bacterium]|jgi:uncharacterized protein YecE (DUF72 family)|nr:DUF72 domain-containing protein [Polyangia bacterium]
MHVLTGTSGFSYPAWRGSFYPEKLPAEKMLAFYARKLGAVEINNTFYRMPRRPLLERWAAETPASFRFAIKSPRQITHMRRLVNVAEMVARLAKGVAVLGDRLGPILFGLPATLRKDVAVLDGFLKVLPSGMRAALEFRDPSWFADDTYDVLRRHDAALCVADSEELATPLVATARWGYLRLRRADYAKAALRRWAKRLQAQRFERAFVFFKHETEAAGPALADSFETMMI